MTQPYDLITFNHTAWAINISDQMRKVLQNKTPIYIFHTSNELNNNEVIEYILEEKTKHNNVAVVFAWPTEAYMTEVITLMNTVIKKLVNEYNFIIDDFYFCNSALLSSYNIEKYKDLLRLYPYVPNNVIFIPYFESVVSRGAIDRVEHHNNFIKKYMFLTRRPRAHRLVLLSELVDRGLYDLGYITTIDFEDKSDYMVNTLFPSYSKSVLEKFDTEYFSNKNLTLLDNTSNMHNMNKEDMLLYSNSMFSLVAETLVFGSITEVDHTKQTNSLALCYPCTFITEKVWKPIRAEQPFIVCSTPYFLRDLREIGYKTYHPYINENYDEIENTEDRIRAIMDEVERLCKLEGNELTEWIINTREIAKFNYEHLRKRKFPNLKLERIYI